MKKIFGIAAASALAIAAFGAPAAAAPPAQATDDVLSGQACQKAGVNVLRTIADSNLVPFVAKNGLNVEISGEPANLSLTEVLAAHRYSPELFAGGEVFVTDLGGAEATWCAVKND